MSNWYANAWVETAPVVDAYERCILSHLAIKAAKDGTGCYRSIASLAAYAKCDQKTARRRIQALEKRKVIAKGDQSLVSHIPRGNRPIVYDLMIPYEWYSAMQLEDVQEERRRFGRPPLNPKDRPPLSEPAEAGRKTRSDKGKTTSELEKSKKQQKSSSKAVKGKTLSLVGSRSEAADTPSLVGRGGLPSREEHVSLVGRGGLPSRETTINYIDKNHLSMDGVDGSSKTQGPKAGESSSGPGKFERLMAELSVSNGVPAHLISQAVAALVLRCPGWNPHEQAVRDVAWIMGNRVWSEVELVPHLCGDPTSPDKINPRLLTSRLRSNAEATPQKINPGRSEGPKNASVDQASNTTVTFKDLANAYMERLAPTGRSV